MEAIHDADVPGSDVGYHLGDEEGTKLGTQLLAGTSIGLNLFLKSLDTSDAHAIDDADTVLVNLFQIHATICNGLRGSSDGILAVEIHLASLLAVDAIVFGLEVLDLTSKLCLELFGIEMGDGCSTTDAIQKVFPRFLDGIADGGDGAKACYYNSFQFHI